MAEGAVADGDVDVHDLMTKEKSFVFEERLAMAGKLRQLGNDRFQGGHIQQAAEAYERGLYHVGFDELQVNFDFNDQHREQLTAAKLPILLNLCMSLARTPRAATGSGDSNARRAVDHASEAIKLDASCAKAWFWRGKAKMDINDLDGSAKDLEEAEKLAPGDKAVRIALKSLRMKTKEHANASRNFWKGMFKSRGVNTECPAPGRRQLEEARARAMGEPTAAVGAGAGGAGGWRKKPGGWGLILLAVTGAVVLVILGLPGSSKLSTG